MRKRRLRIADCADTADCPDYADCRVQPVRLRTARLQPVQTADFADLTDCPNCADYPDGRLRSLCRPQTVQTADNEDC